MLCGLWKWSEYRVAHDPEGDPHLMRGNWLSLLCHSLRHPAAPAVYARSDQPPPDLFADAIVRFCRYKTL